MPRSFKTLMFQAAAIIASALMMTSIAGTSKAASTAAAAVRIDNFTFKAPLVTVTPGTTVTWTNGDDIPHTVVSTSGAFKSKVLDSGDQYSFTFAKAGRFDYFCSLHPHMTGTILVKG